MSLIVPKKEMEVRKSEALLNARYQLGELAIKLVSIIYSNVKRTDEYGKDYQIKVADIATLMGKSYGEMYNLLKDAIKEMLNNPIKIEDEEKKEWVMFNWISDALYKDGVISFTISKHLKPYILELQTKFLKYRLENILNLRGTYVIRLYEILKDIYEKNKRYGNKTEKIFEVKQLREMLEIPKSYQYSSGIKLRILEKAKEQFENYTDIIFKFEEIKTGRKVTHLKFTIMPNLAKVKNSNTSKSFTCIKYFVELLRDKYKGKGKWGYKSINGENYWLGLDNKGLVYAVSNNNIVDFNSNESEELYNLWLTIAQNSLIYQNILEQGLSLDDLKNNNNSLWEDLIREIQRLKENRVI